MKSETATPAGRLTRQRVQSANALPQRTESAETVSSLPLMGPLTRAQADLPDHPTARALRLARIARLQPAVSNSHVQRLMRSTTLHVSRVEASGDIGGGQALLRLGSVGPEVVALQAQLNGAGANPPLVPDGQFGPATQAAVIAFQRSHGLQPDGIVGSKTRDALASNPTDTTEDKSGVDSLLEPASFGTDPTPEQPAESESQAGELPGLGPSPFGEPQPQPEPQQAVGASSGSCEQGRSFVNPNSSSGLVGSIFFCTDKFDLDPDNDVLELQKLRAYEPLLKQRKVKFVFIGFADVRGSDPHNQTLSENRAKSVEGFVRNLLKDDPNYDREIQGLGRSASFPGFLEGARRVDILAEPAVRPPVTERPPVPGSKKSRDWKAKILHSAGVLIVAGFRMLLVDKTNKLQMEFVFDGVGPGIGTPASIQKDSDFFDFTTSQQLEFHEFEGPGTWRSTQLQIFVGPSTDVIVLLGPRFNAGDAPVELRYEDLLGRGFGIGVSVMGGQLTRFDKTPSPAP